MKHLFLLFLAVNIGLFIWGYQREQAAEHKRPRAHADVGELRLLAERKTSSKSESIPDPKPVRESARVTEEKAQDLMEPMIVAASEEPKVSKPEQAEEELELEQQPLLEEEEHKDSQSTQQVVDELNQVTPVVEVEKTNTDLPELEFEEQVELTQIAEAEQELQEEMLEKPELQAPKLICYKLGPIVNLPAVDGVSKQLKQLGFDAVLHKDRVKKAKGYWVMYPPQKTYEQAKEKFREIKETGISDLWLFPKGVHKNAISLGLYSRRVNAEAANKRAKQKGLATEVLVRYVDVDQHWLEFQDTERLSISEESRLALLEAYPGEEFEFKPCSSVVTE